MAALLLLEIVPAIRRRRALLRSRHWLAGQVHQQVFAAGFDALEGAADDWGVAFDAGDLRQLRGEAGDRAAAERAL